MKPDCQMHKMQNFEILGSRLLVIKVESMYKYTRSWVHPMHKYVHVAHVAYVYYLNKENLQVTFAF